MGGGGGHTEGGAGSSHTHRVGDMSHGFDVEKLLEYELQLVLRALGRPGRGAGGEQPSVPPLPPRSRGIRQPGTTPWPGGLFLPQGEMLGSPHPLQPLWHSSPRRSVGSR